MRFYERLISCHEIVPRFYGQRQWSSQDIYEDIKSIETQNLKGICSKNEIHQILSKLSPFVSSLENKLKKNISLSMPENGSIDYLFLSGGDSTFRANGRGQINTAINTFRENKLGQVAGIGHQLSIMSDHELLINQLKLTAFLQLRADILFSNQLDNVDDSRFTAQQSYLLVEPWKLKIIAGRAPVIWGQNQYGGFLFSENVRPLDHFQMTHSPGSLPNILRYLGKWKTSFIFGTLGPEQNHPWALFSGLSIGLKPHDNFEMNLSHIFQFGGEGAPKIGFGMAMQELFGFIPFGISQTSQGGTNKITAINFRWFWHKFMGSQFYLGYLADDSNLTGGPTALKKHFSHNSSYNFGIYLTRPFNSLKDSFRFDLKSTGPISYRHSTFQSGWTENKNIVGDALGPDAWQLSAQWHHEWTELYESQIDVIWKRRESNTYNVSADGYSAFIAQDGPEEIRTALISGNIFNLKHFKINTQLGYELINNYQFIQGNTKHTFLFNTRLSKSFK